MRRWPVLILLTFALFSGCRAQETRVDVPVNGGVIHATLPTLAQPSQDDLMIWIHNAVDAVTAYYGKFPAEHLELRVRSGFRSGIHHGVTYPSGGGLIVISVGDGTSKQQLNDDWTLTHEMIHLAFPSLRDEHHWLEEGISTYVEPVARVKTGNMPVEQLWKQYVNEMPQGEPEQGDEGLDNTHTWGRTYWGGAMFCLLADVRIRQATNNRKGLQDALRGILDAGGSITEDWPIERALQAGDKTTGTTVLSDLYAQMKDKPSPADLQTLWRELGVSRQGSTVVFDDHAPLADIRKAITAKRD